MIDLKAWIDSEVIEPGVNVLKYKDVDVSCLQYSFFSCDKFRRFLGRFPFGFHTAERKIASRYARRTRFSFRETMVEEDYEYGGSGNHASFELGIEARILPPYAHVALVPRLSRRKGESREYAARTGEHRRRKGESREYAARTGERRRTNR